MITLCLLAVITLLTGMLIIEGNATDRAEKRYDNILSLYNKNCSLLKRAKEERDDLKFKIDKIEENYHIVLDIETESPTVFTSRDHALLAKVNDKTKKAKKRLKKRTAGRPKVP